MTQDSIERTLGIILGKIDGIEDRMDRAEKSREGIHQRLDQFVIRTTNLEADVFATKNKVETMASVTDDVMVLRQRVEGAGTLGRWLLRLAIGSVGIAGWLIGIYTWITGKPPP